MANNLGLNKPLLIHRLAYEHASSYRLLMLEAYNCHPEAFTSSVVERAALPLSWWESRLIDDVVIGAFERTTLLGTVGMQFNTREKVRHIAKLFGMYIQPHCRSQGTGFQVVQVALDYAQRHGGIRLVQLTVSEGNSTAQALYERCGFTTFGVEPMAVAVEDGFVAKVHMWRALAADT
jgi:RimJ/RimL family protein N-acetyltransferase